MAWKTILGKAKPRRHTLALTATASAAARAAAKSDKRKRKRKTGERKGGKAECRGGIDACANHKNAIKLPGRG